MDLSLLELLGKSPAESGSFTHVSFYGPACRWQVKNHDLSNFWKTYCTLVHRRDTGRYALGEKVQDVMPILVRGTLQFADVDVTSFDPYKDDFLLAVVYCYQQALK